MIRLLVCVFVSFSVAGNEISPEQMEKFKKELWSLQQPLKIDVEQEGWGKTPVDGFILKKLKEQSLSPSGQASKRTLIRRAYYNLIGLPPTAAEIQRFENDHSEKAYEKLIDQLLAKPEYGEKWARHWMDVARFADTKGFLPAGRDQSYPFSYTYRDYLIRAFNSDKPYTEFIKEQLAADQFELEDKRDLAALGFLTAADRFLNRPHEIINDRIDVTTQGFLGLTVACSRCHDHKFDPIPTADYYSMYGIFASITEPKPTDLPIINLPKNKEAHKKYLKKYDELVKEKEEIDEGYRKGFFDDWQEVAQDYIEIIGKSVAGVKDLKKIDSKEREMRKRLITDVSNLLTRNKHQDPFWGLWNRGIRISEHKLPGLLKGSLKREDTAKILKLELSKQKITTKKQFFAFYSKLIKKVISEKADYPEIYNSFAGKAFKELIDKQDVKRYVSNAEDGKIRKIENKISAHLATDGAPARAMVVEDKSKPYDPRIFVRGKPETKGDKVPRRFLQALSYAKHHEKFTKGSGRLELAESIADKKNPLTARVLVNRVWQWHTGLGLVSTPSNFGVLGSKPSHPQLLDYLAVWFMDNGWSIKKLNKFIMTSAFYLQQSNSRPEMEEKDEANIYLWKMNRRRLSWEELRDSIVFSTGKLKDFNGGKGIELLAGNYQPYRTVYGYLTRDKIAGAYKAFDFPSASITCETRTKTIVPQQGLFLLNSQFVQRSARMTNAGLTGTGKDRIQKLFERIYGRQASLEELEFSFEFLEQAEHSFKEKVFPEWLYGIATLNEKDELKEFTEFKVFNKSRWQISKSFPNKKTGYAYLSKNGGHPGNGDVAVVRRCKMNQTGKLSIKGLLEHKNDKGDGVRVLVLHNGVKIGEWDCRKERIPTEIQDVLVVAGDVIDLVVDAKKNPTSDQFVWPVSMSMTMPTSSKSVSLEEDFRKEVKQEKFTAWHGLAQVLMMSNEFLYVD